MIASLLKHPRHPFLLLFATCVGLLGFGLYLQYYGGYEPCPMCIMQRYAFVAVALIALIAGLHGSGGGARRGYGLLLLVAALAGGGVAARQSWIQIYPPAVSECGPGLEFMLESFPLADALPMIFRGAGDCTERAWTFLGLSIANWSLVCFAVIALFGVLVALRRPR
ncbi:disulfide bond formation protein B [Cognatazoarcus halotolerans]|uniref:disulfide bond formation protein B n=1 Tax=Cognatazoarcus halotolerans TaxID=2686016 RepID=UPI001359BD23|nr:disulfide bond formation protein B [Cognatazoarcus halotolerans]MBX3680218.1 disulfide bond formation protein B [Rhodocyclaceae bacterium]MCB1899045.1 disulfide bond formation protein B [Rhodocyclaceae bacterium]MCP5308063.1 disulfide bond formation protein B [Zoogloeaceae bacterium]